MRISDGCFESEIRFALLLRWSNPGFEEVGNRRRLSLKRMSAIAGLSESRFMHVFTESVGVPLRPYILWLRLQCACSEMMRGSSLTEAAHRAGFADAAHLCRTAKRMMGTTATVFGNRLTPGRLQRQIMQSAVGR